MDNLSLRRELYEDPSSIRPQDLADEPQLQLLQQQLLQQDQELRNTLNIRVPAQLIEKVLLQQQLTKPRWYRRPVPYASAAALLLSLWFWQQSPHVQSPDLGQHALSHVYHELAALRATTMLSAEDVQPLFTELGINSTLPAPVLYARFCNFEGVRALHVVMTLDGQPITLFVIPDAAGQPADRTQQFADARFVGQVLHAARHRLVLVAEQPQLLAQLGPQLINSLKFNI